MTRLTRYVLIAGAIAAVAWLLREAYGVIRDSAPLGDGTDGECLDHMRDILGPDPEKWR